MNWQSWNIGSTIISSLDRIQKPLNFKKPLTGGMASTEEILQEWTKADNGMGAQCEHKLPILEPGCSSRNKIGSRRITVTSSKVGLRNLQDSFKVDKTKKADKRR
jgi:hypothetical protein